jgi:hypothetical protein
MFLGGYFAFKSAARSIESRNARVRVARKQGTPKLRKWLGLTKMIRLFSQFLNKIAPKRPNYFNF